MLREKLGRQVWHRTELGTSEELIVSSLGLVQTARRNVEVCTGRQTGA